MIVNETNYRAIARHLTEHNSLVQKAQSYNQLTALVNTLIKESKIKGCSPQLRLQTATISTIVYAIEGAMDILDD